MVSSSVLFWLVLWVPRSRPGPWPCPWVGEWGPKLEGTLAGDHTCSPGKVGGTFRTAEGQPRRPRSGSVESLQVTENVHTKRPTWPRAPAPQLCWVAQWSAVTGGKHTAPLNQPTNLSTAMLLHRLTKPPSIQTVAPGPLHLCIDRKTCTSSISDSTAYQEAGVHLWSPEMLSPAPHTPWAQSSLLGSPPPSQNCLPSLEPPASGPLLPGGLGSGTWHRPARARFEPSLGGPSESQGSELWPHTRPVWVGPSRCCTTGALQRPPPEPLPCVGLLNLGLPGLTQLGPRPCDAVGQPLLPGDVAALGL